MTDTHPDPIHIRLAKRVAEQLNCSRSTAEQFIEGGFVSVDGRVEEAPGARVRPDQAVVVAQDASLLALTPVAIREGQAFADTFFGGKPRQVDYGCVPSAVFSHPPLAGVGLTEGQARNRLGSVKTFTSDFRPMKNVLAGRNERSLYKLVLDGATDEIVGVHMIGPDAPELLQVAAIAVKAKLKKDDFDATIALHPTMAEELVLMR